MGLCGSSEQLATDKQDVVRNREINDEIEKDKQQSVRKLLLLGAGECGKTTILKQMRLLHDQFTENEMLFYKPMVYQMVNVSMNATVEAMEDLGFHFENSSNNKCGQRIKEVILSQEEQHPFESDVRAAHLSLWADAGVKKAFEQRDKFHVHDAAKYFFDEIDRIAEDGYRPNMQDILNVRVATLGVQEVRFTYKTTIFRVFDVGGQKSQRRKWIHVFDDVDSIIFISAISEFNQQMREDSKVNRLLDSLTLFGEMCKNEYFLNTSLILFFNKTDLFREKLKSDLSIKTAFPDYDGPNEYEKSVQFLNGKFRNEMAEGEKQLYVHETCATNTDQVRIILLSVTDIVMNKKMNSTGF